MSTYLVTGASRGLGFEFLRQLSNDPSSTVIGLSRNKRATDEKVKAELIRDNIHIVEADIADHKALNQAAEDTAKLTGGKLDYIIANAAFDPEWSNYKDMRTLALFNAKMRPTNGANEPEALEKDLLESFQANVVGTIHLFNSFVPLLKQGTAKKVIAITTGMADVDLTAKYDVDLSAPYSISKSGVNLAVAKFSAQYRKEGILFMGISPRFVDTGKASNISEEDQQGLQRMATTFSKYAPQWTGPLTPEESAKAVLAVMEKANVQNGDGGSFVSHFGNKQWI